MPWKRNPINAENINSMARHLAQLPQVAWQNWTASLLERTLDDSANRRSILPEACLMADEILRRLQRLLDVMRIEDRAVAALLERYGPFAATERVLLAAAAAGGDRQALHEVIRGHSLTAWSRGRAASWLVAQGRTPARGRRCHPSPPFSRRPWRCGPIPRHPRSGPPRIRRCPR